jgi:tRNA threonylcarbamoyl adenosine modification protein YeaZ
MKILAFEFASAQRSVAVACGKAHVREVIETTPGKGMRPFGMIEAALEAAEVDRSEIDCIVVGLGPGSYTGIRVGIALAQGWQLARNVKLLGISSVEAVATQAQSDGLRGAANVIVDAQRGEFYLATWELGVANARETQPLHIVGREAIESLTDNGALLMGPEVTKWFPTGRIVYPRAATLATLAALRMNFMSGDELEPIYLRETTFVKAPPARVV